MADRTNETECVRMGKRQVKREREEKKRGRLQERSAKIEKCTGKEVLEKGPRKEQEWKGEAKQRKV